MSAYMPIITPKEMSGIERNVTILTGRDKAIPWLLPGVARNARLSTHAAYRFVT